ncbi:MAG: hypothetical protein IAE97_06320 [Chthoniobacterales bacterium]|nr:hypothetical protein [Chthoniobacterales bacterium]
MKPSSQHLVEISLRVLLSEEDGQVCAHALEVDLVGYGPDEETAMRDLVDAIGTQVSFAVTENKPGVIYFPAPKEEFDRWERVHRESLQGFPRTRKGKFRATVLVWSPAKATKQEFVPACA